MSLSRRTILKVAGALRRIVVRAWPAAEHRTAGGRTDLL